MRIVSIFAPNTEDKIWSVCDYNNKKWVPVFQKLTDKFKDTNFIIEYLNEHSDDLTDPYWDGYSKDDIIDQILDEGDSLFHEFYKIQKGKPNRRSVSDIFIPYHNNTFSIKTSGDHWRKAKADRERAILRFYGVILDDGTIIITGGFIKLTETIPEVQKEIQERAINNLTKYLKENYIIDVSGLKNN
jgi:hypothetical protein